jgi:hypothetical protein
MQSKWMSLVESVSNILVGFGISLLAQIWIFPYYGIKVSMHDHLSIGACFTVVSLVRSYVLRRVFNKMMWSKITQGTSFHNQEIRQQEQDLLQVTTRLKELRNYSANWDNEGAKKPDSKAIDRAITLINLMYLAAQEASAWKEPSTIAPDAYGRIFLIWWHGQGKSMRDISIYISSDAITGIRTWGQSSKAKVDGIPISLNKDNLKDVWKWLMGR